MDTKHLIITANANNTQKVIPDESVALVVTSPPYPMIEMWDEIFGAQSKVITGAFGNDDYDTAYMEMHKILDKIWDDVNRVLIDGGIVCINIGDATRNCKGRFKLFSNHSRIIEKFVSMGFDVLPDIHWHKPTNAPNKFMGSGMYPPCAYVTYEHEYILIFRKGSNRSFNGKERATRHSSSYFWEERNIWFSDLWELKGTTQKLKCTNSRERSAAFPFELAYRLVNMYSIKGDLVYDPFCGTGTVARAAMAAERNSVGVDIDCDLCESAIEEVKESKKYLNSYIRERICRHRNFVEMQSKEKIKKMYNNINHDFMVKTRQEVELLISKIKSIEQLDGEIICQYEKADA